MNVHARLRHAPPPYRRSTPRPAMFYDDINVHRTLVGDRVRTGAFFDSLTATVSPGDVVLDVGAGSGILSLFAAQAGASRVYAIERAPGAAALARRLIAENGLQDRIYVLQGEAEHMILPERVDVLVSEWLGVYGVDENMLGSVLIARDRWLKPSGTMIPGTVTVWIAPVAHPAAQEVVELYAQPYGLNLAPMAAFPLNEAVWLPLGTTPDLLRAEPQPMWVVDPARTSAAEARSPFHGEGAFRLDGGGVNGLAVWFSASMPGAGDLSNGPGRALTHWGQFLFPVASVGDASAGDELFVTLDCLPGGQHGSQHRWSVRWGDGRPEMHDTRRTRKPAWMPPWHVFSGDWMSVAEGRTT